jgi:peroxiredoxin
MKMKFLSALAGLALLIPAQPAFSAETNAVSVELQSLVSRINNKIKEDKKSESDFAGELKEFDAIVAKHKGEDPETLTQVLSMKGRLYLEVLEEPEKASEVFKQIKKDYPQTKAGEHVDEVLQMIAQQAENKRIQDALAVGTTFPDFSEKDLGGKPLSLANYKGKTVLLDFWATWCPPCRAELPNVISVYQKFHKDGFEIIGVSLDEDKAKLDAFIADKKMAWPQYFDGEGWKNKLAVKYGVNSIPATYLLDGDRKIIGKDLHGEDLEKAVAAAIAKK